MASSDSKAVDERVPPRTRAFVAVFLTAFIVCGLIGIEAWPLTGWRLFSHLRRDRTSSWSAVTVDGGGRETPIPFGRLPRGYRWATHILLGFPSLPSAEQIAVCDAWASAVRRHGREVVSIRIYRVERSVARRAGSRGAPLASRTLRYTCDDRTVRTEGGANAQA